MILDKGLTISDDAIEFNLKRLTNQIYKLLPSREEGLEWCKPLETIIEELYGMSNIGLGQDRIFFSLICKLQGLFALTAQEDFLLFRRTIFECLRLINDIKQEVL